MKERCFILLFLVCLGAAPAAAAQAGFTAAQLDNLVFHQHPGAALPLQTPLLDEDGRTVTLGSFFGQKRPVVLVLDYLHCKTLCGFVLSDLVRGLSEVPLTGGKDYEVLAISIDPRETPADSRAARAQYLARTAHAGGWHFLTATDANVHRIAQVVGFPYLYDAVGDQYAHPAGVTIAAPDGTIARYVLGVDYAPLDLRLALTEAARGTISTPVTELLLLCYCYDPETGRYSAQIDLAMKILCGVTLVGLGVMIMRLSGFQLRRS